MKLIDLLVVFGNNARQMATSMHYNRNALLALLLAATLVAVQSALPWMHVGCEHDHSVAHAAEPASGHHHCRGHHHHCAADAEPAAATKPAFDHRHEQVRTDECAACRYLLLSSVAVEPTAVSLIEQVTLLPAPPAIAAAASELVGLYRSRAPPALS